MLGFSVGNIEEGVVALEDEEIDGYARKLWDFQSRSDVFETVNSIVVLGSYDLRVAEYAAASAVRWPRANVIITGGLGNWTRSMGWSSEADVFAQLVEWAGVSKLRLALDRSATNIGENVKFAKEWKEAPLGDVVFLTKPQTQLRVRLTIPLYEFVDRCYVDAPRIDYVHYARNDTEKVRLINEMVGDIERIIKYPKYGFQTPCDVPNDVIDAAIYLTRMGFDKHILKK